eukprot:TRINITY_DN727_c0_g1_i2.p3 TRINITY_DN727_c0_g1~~TRINITY_DN727_c0_g1_i2.p3  ORF type:complete len:121 (+),score=17.93 TRINITY_DN727_c0_g1_i2:654-1016(+)
MAPTSPRRRTRLSPSGAVAAVAAVAVFLVFPPVGVEATPVGAHGPVAAADKAAAAIPATTAVKVAMARATVAAQAAVTAAAPIAVVTRPGRSAAAAAEEAPLVTVDRGEYGGGWGSPPQA